MSGLPKHLYLAPSLSTALNVLEALEDADSSMTLADIYEKTKVPRKTILQILDTLASRGYVSQNAGGWFGGTERRDKRLIGVLLAGSEPQFNLAVAAALSEAAEATGVDILIHENIDQTVDARNAMSSLLREKVDLLIEFHLSPPLAALVGHIATQSMVPLIGVDMPHPNAVYVGVDRYRAGLQAGKRLGQYTIDHWKGRVGSVLGLDVLHTDPLIKCRTAAALEGVRACLPGLPKTSFVRIDGREERSGIKALVADFLVHRPTMNHILIAAATGQIALGVADAIKEQRADLKVAIVTHDAGAEVMTEMESPCSPIIGSTVRHARIYGQHLIRIALSILRGNAIPPYNYVEFSFVRKTDGARVVALASAFNNQTPRSEQTIPHLLSTRSPQCCKTTADRYSDAVIGRRQPLEDNVRNI